MQGDGGKTGVTSRAFLRAWEGWGSVEQVAGALGQPLDRVCAWERRCRREGLALRELPRARRPVAAHYGPSAN